MPALARKRLGRVEEAAREHSTLQPTQKRSPSAMDIRIEPASDAVPQPLPTELGFGRVFTNRMFTQRYTAERGWHDATIGPYQALTLDPAAQVFHCGQMVFEGTKAYRRPDGNLNLF